MHPDSRIDHQRIRVFLHQPPVVPSIASHAGSELERKINKMGLVPEHSPKIEAATDEADLIAYPVSYEGGLRVVEDDTFLTIDPARLTDDASENGIETEHGDFVHKDHLLCIEDLALPGKDVNELGDLGRDGGARRDDCRPFRIAVRNGAGFDALEEVIELGMGHCQQLCNVIGHCDSFLLGYETSDRKEDWTIGGEDKMVDDSIF